jgi:hypothetical protein
MKRDTDPKYFYPEWIETFFLPHVKLLETHSGLNKTPLFETGKAPLIAPKFYGLQQVTVQKQGQSSQSSLSIFEPIQMFRHLSYLPEIKKELKTDSDDSFTDTLETSTNSSFH